MEDVSELQVQHVVYLETRPADGRGRGQLRCATYCAPYSGFVPTASLLVKSAAAKRWSWSRHYPTGHGGSMTTLHANHAIDAMHRLETMCMMSDIQLPVAPLRAQIISAIDVVVQQNRLRDGSRRVVGIYEVEGLGTQGEYVMRPLFEFKFQGEIAGTGANSRQPGFHGSGTNVCSRSASTRLSVGYQRTHIRLTAAFQD